MSKLEEAARTATEYLYSLDGDVTPEQYDAISALRQLTNEEFVRTGKQISNQTIYEMLKGIL